ncbi:hypothetical protein [Devosia sp.]
MPLFYRRHGKAQASALKIGPLNPARIVGRIFEIVQANIAKDMLGQMQRPYGATMLWRLCVLLMQESRGKGQEKAKKAGQSEHLMHSLALWPASSLD